MDNSILRAYRFGAFRLDRQRQELTGPGGESLNLPARAYAVLVYLLENRDRVVGKDELMKAVWPTTVVEENNLNQAVTAVRRALGDRRDAPQYVRTIAGRGYRFVGDVTAEDGVTIPTAAPALSAGDGDHATGSGEAVCAESTRAAEASHDPRRRRLLIGIGLGVAAAGGVAWFVRSYRATQSRARVRSLAVLPFRPLIEGSGDPVLELGMADELITRLSTVPGLVVRPLSSVRRYNAADEDPLRAGAELGVDAVLEGHLLIERPDVRVTARLLEVATGLSIWSGRLKRPLGKIFEARDSIAGPIVSALQIEMTDRDRERLYERPTSDVEAWGLYLNGRFHWERKTPEGFQRAIEYYQAAERRDPAFVLAAVGQADCWAVLGVHHAIPPAVAFERAAVAAERALGLDPESPEAMATMGHVLVQGRRDWAGGERLYRRALASKPRLAQCRMWLANICAYHGRLGEALVEARRAQEHEPMSLTFAANVGLILYLMRDYAASLAQLEPLVEAAPQFPLARQHLARALIAGKNPGRALSLVDGLPVAGPNAHSIRGCALAALGRRDEAHAEIRTLEDTSARGFGVALDITMIHAALGNADAALTTLERAARDPWQQLGFLKSEPGLDSIRNDPRFRAVSRQVGLG